MKKSNPIAPRHEVGLVYHFDTDGNPRGAGDVLRCAVPGEQPGHQRLQDELEQRVEERTRELKEAQARLVDRAREVGMAEVASNVLHNVGV